MQLWLVCYVISLARKSNTFFERKHWLASFQRRYLLLVALHREHSFDPSQQLFFYFCMLSTCILFSNPPQVEAVAWCHIWCNCYCYSNMMIRWSVMIFVSQYCYNHIPHVTKSLHHNNSVSQNCKIKRKILHRTRTAAENACCSTLWLRLIRDVSWRRSSASASASLSYYQHHSITTSASASVEASLPSSKFPPWWEYVILINQGRVWFALILSHILI